MTSNKTKKNIATIVATTVGIGSVGGLFYNNSREPPKHYSHEQMYEYNKDYYLIDAGCIAGMLVSVLGLGAYSRKLKSDEELE